MFEYYSYVKIKWDREGAFFCRIGKQVCLPSDTERSITAPRLSRKIQRPTDRVDHMLQDAQNRHRTGSEEECVDEWAGSGWINWGMAFIPRQQHSKIGSWFVMQHICSGNNDILQKWQDTHTHTHTVKSPVTPCMSLFDSYLMLFLFRSLPPHELMRFSSTD